MKFKRKIKIELLEEHEVVNFYSLLFDNEELTEFEKFIIENKLKYPVDDAIILKRISKIGESGAFERYFRYAGKKNDRTVALPSHLDTSKLRVYCIRISEEIVILGSGGEKNTKTYNENQILNDIVNTLIKVDSAIKDKENCKKISIENNNLKGNLTIKIQ